jgi:acyl phosphate:glycerol-3-phosphate acyltransferase
MAEILTSPAAWLALGFGYLLGSIPFGLILTRAAGLGDVRKIGSGNIGATNVLRTGNKGIAAATLLLDALKATVAVWIVHWLLKSGSGLAYDYVPGVAFSQPPAGWGTAYRTFMIAALAGAGAFVGHIYPVWLGFKGGKGVATFIGAMLGVFWPIAAMFCGAWLLLALASRYSSLAALGASMIAVVYPFMLGEYALGVLTLAMVAPTGRRGAEDRCQRQVHRPRAMTPLRAEHGSHRPRCRKYLSTMRSAWHVCA